MTNEDLYPGYNRISGGSSTEQKSLWMSFRKAIWASISMAFSLILPTAFTIMFLYVDLNTADLCIQWQRHNNTVPFSVMQIRAIGISVEVLLINLWFPLTAVILFDWKDFKLRFLPVLYIAFIFAEATVIYKLLLLAFGVLETHTYYRYSSNILFFISIICCSIVMVCSIRMRVSVPYSNLHIMVLLSTQLLLCSIVSCLILSASKKRNTNSWWLRWSRQLPLSHP